MTSGLSRGQFFDSQKCTLAHVLLLQRQAVIEETVLVAGAVACQLPFRVLHLWFFKVLYSTVFCLFVCVARSTPLQFYFIQKLSLAIFHLYYCFPRFYDDSLLLLIFCLSWSTIFCLSELYSTKCISRFSKVNWSSDFFWMSLIKHNPNIIGDSSFSIFV